MVVLQLSPSRALLSSLLVVFFVANIDMTQAKRGCSAFGHSCFGGHGKRSDTPGGPSDPEEVPLGLQSPVSDVAGLLGGRGSVEYFSRDQGPVEGQEVYRPVEQDELSRLAPIFRKWLTSYRRSEMFGVRK